MVARARRVLVLCPMPIELKPVVRRLKLAPSHDGARIGRVGKTEVVAALGGIGPAAAGDTARRLVASHEPDHVAVCGVAGGVAASVKVGDLVVPAMVVDLADGTASEAHRFGDAEPTGRILTSEALIVDRAVMDGHAADGVDAVDMETSAVAAACDEVGIPWTAFRGISDHYADELMDGSTLGLMHADGTPDLGAVARYVARRPANVTRLAKLARGTSAATAVATRALVSAIEADAAAH
jgi:nucleoside phosphorylase